MIYELTVCFVLFFVFQDSKDIVLLSSEPMVSEEKFLVICIIGHINIVLTLLFDNDAIWIPCGLFSCLFCLIIFGIIFFFWSVGFFCCQLECWLTKLIQLETKLTPGQATVLLEVPPSQVLALQRYQRTCSVYHSSPPQCILNSLLSTTEYHSTARLFLYFL